MKTEKRLIDASPDDCIKKTKCKTNFAKIIVSGTADKPYYEIMWFNYMDGQYHIGYSSYNLHFVFQWLSECFEIEEAPTVDAYTEEQVANLIQQTEMLAAMNKELEKEVSWLKSCINCKLRKECPRHCGKVVHDCDHWEYGDSTVDAVEVVHGRWVKGNWSVTCSICGSLSIAHDGKNYCPYCGAKMDGERKNGE